MKLFFYNTRFANITFFKEFWDHDILLILACGFMLEQLTIEKFIINSRAPLSSKSKAAFLRKAMKGNNMPWYS